MLPFIRSPETQILMNANDQPSCLLADGLLSVYGQEFGFWSPPWCFVGARSGRVLIRSCSAKLTAIIS